MLNIVEIARSFVGSSAKLPFLQEEGWVAIGSPPMQKVWLALRNTIFCTDDLSIVVHFRSLLIKWVGQCKEILWTVATAENILRLFIAVRKHGFNLFALYMFQR